VLSSTRTFVNNLNFTAGFSRGPVSGSDLFNGPTDSAFATWDMRSSIGPVSGFGSLLQWNNQAVTTNAGRLLFDDAVVQDASFHAIVPEPSSMALLAMAIAAGTSSLVPKFARRSAAC